MQIRPVDCVLILGIIASCLICSISGLNNSTKSSSVKKELKIPPDSLNATIPDAAKNLTIPAGNVTKKVDDIGSKEASNDKQSTQQPLKFPFKTDFYLDSNNYGPNLFSMLLVFISFSLVIIGFFVYRSFKLRRSRAERKYGVQGDREAQELTPLPMAMDEDSDFDDQTLFDISNTKVYGH